jgi:hypothetical protein
MEREASLYEWERALEERVLRLELQEKLLAKKELAVDRTSRSLHELQGSLEVELKNAAAVVAAGGDGREQQDEEVAKLREEMEEAKNEATTLRSELESLRARWDFVSGVDSAIKAATEAAVPTSAALRTLRTHQPTSSQSAAATSESVVVVNVSDLTALRRDHEAQERLLEGFQKENERLVNQMTELKHTVARERRDMGREREAMHKEVNNLRNQLTGQGLATDSDRLQVRSGADRDRQTDRQTNRQTNRQTARQPDKQTDTQTDRHLS